MYYRRNLSGAKLSWCCLLILIGQQACEATRNFTRAEVAKHHSTKSCWVIMSNNVYNLTDFLDSHPGGERPILEVAGGDGTIRFANVDHSGEAKMLRKKYLIGGIVAAERREYHDDDGESR